MKISATKQMKDYLAFRKMQCKKEYWEEDRTPIDYEEINKFSREELENWEDKNSNLFEVRFAEAKQFLQDRYQRQAVGDGSYEKVPCTSEKNPYLIALTEAHKAFLRFLSFLCVLVGLAVATYFIYRVATQDYSFFAGVLVFVASFGLASMVIQLILSVRAKEIRVFERQINLHESALLSTSQYFDAEWVTSRYAVKVSATLVGNVIRTDEATYGWKEVQPSKFIIVNEATGEEASLLPGQKTYA